MDGHRFDTVVRTLARGGTRRTLLGGIAASGALVLDWRLRLPGAAARRNTKAAGEACWDDAQCVAADTALVCAWNGYGSAGAACCAYDGSRCGDDAGCCGTSLCLGGWCGPAGVDVSPGDVCQQGVDTCVYASGAFFCDYVSLTEDFRCCAYQGDPCGWDGQCCYSSRCSDAGICVPLG